jgi:hypothetical protein
MRSFYANLYGVLLLRSTCYFLFQVKGYILMSVDFLQRVVATNPGVVTTPMIDAWHVFEVVGSDGWLWLLLIWHHSTHVVAMSDCDFYFKQWSRPCGHFFYFGSMHAYMHSRPRLGYKLLHDQGAFDAAHGSKFLDNQTLNANIYLTIYSIYNLFLP